MKTPPKEIIEYVQKPGTSFLTLHKSPDMDSLGSNLALAQILRDNDHEVTIYSEDEVPDDFLFLTNADNVEIIDAYKIPWHTCDYFWALDMGDDDRNGFKGEYPASITIINIDHHASNDLYGNSAYVIKDAPSTSSLILNIARELEYDLSVETAEALMTGLGGDTGFFSYAVDPQAFEDASYLLQKGVDYGKIIREIRKNTPLDVIQAVGEVIQDAQVYEDGRIVVLYVPAGIVERVSNIQLLKGMLNGFQSSIQGTDWGMLITDDRLDSVSISLRARTDAVDVAKVAECLGGGGHVRAAGARVNKMPREELIQKVIDCSKHQEE